MIDSKQMIFSNDALLNRVLIPYKTYCHYLERAQVEFRQPALNSLLAAQDIGLALAKGEFSIPESCYIAATGHFNSVEFNICYNQLAYYLLAECVQHRFLNDLLDWDVEEYINHQLSNILIVEFSSSFHRKMRSDKFNGYIEIKKIFKNRKNTIFFETVCGFKDNGSGFSTGKVTLAII